MKLFAYALISLLPLIWVLGAWCMDFLATECGHYRSDV